MAAGAVTSQAKASLIYQGPVSVGGTGLGDVNTILTIHHNTSETGTVSWVAPGVESDTGDLVGIYGTQTVSALNLTGQSNVDIIFNISQTGSNPQITLDNLVLTIYSSTGTALWSSGAFTATDFVNSDAGTGNSGFGFTLDATQAAAAAPYLTTGTNRIGLSATAGIPGFASNDGNETFYVASPTIVNTPEPASIALLGAGLIGVWGAGRAKRKNG